MASREVRRLVGAAIACVLASPSMVVGDGRKNTRDFPDGTLCPVNLGWFVDPVLGTIVPPPTQPIRPPLHTFTATGIAAAISLASCDRGLTDDHPDGFDLWIRDFAVVRQDVYTSHQVANADPTQQCYVPHGLEDPFFRTVGSTFKASVAPAVSRETLNFPFFDDFSNLTLSQWRWRLDGAEFKTVELNVPGSGPLVAPALVLARVPASAGQNSCSKASVVVGHLRKGQTYVIDFQWESKGVVVAPEVEMLTFVDSIP